MKYSIRGSDINNDKHTVEIVDFNNLVLNEDNTISITGLNLDGKKFYPSKLYVFNNVTEIYTPINCFVRKEKICINDKLRNYFLSNIPKGVNETKYKDACGELNSCPRNGGRKLRRKSRRKTSKKSRHRPSKKGGKSRRGRR